MDFKQYQSLPPRVEGKVHGYLKLTIDQVVWSQKSPGDVSVLVSWWGQNDSVEFRPIDVKSGSFKLENYTEKYYLIRTNRSLFQDYIGNCESLKLVVLIQETNEVIGTAHVFNLLDIFSSKPFSRYFPILNENNTRLGDIHVSVRLLNLSKSLHRHKMEYDLLSNRSEMKGMKYKPYKSEEDRNLVSVKYDYPHDNKSTEQFENIYTTILKNNDGKFKKTDLEKPKKFNIEVTDKLVAQAIARAQRLRGVILKQSQEDEQFIINNNAFFDTYPTNNVLENEAKLCEYILGNDITAYDECKALDTLKSTSPTPSLINFISKEIPQYYNNEFTLNKEAALSSVANEQHSTENESYKCVHHLNFQSKEPSPLDYVDSFKILVECLTLSSAGYRRVKSSCLSRDNGAISTVTYFVQYDPIFASHNDQKKRFTNEKKIVKISSRKQFGEAIYFNHKAVYNVPTSCLYLSMPLKFKVYHRHFNQRSPTELGIGLMYVSDSTATKYLSTTQRVAIVNKGIKVGELKVTVELGCDGVHFGKEFVDAILGEKENIPVLEDTALVNKENMRYRSATGTESKPNSKVTVVPAKQLDCVGSSSIMDSNDGKCAIEHTNSENFCKTSTTDNNCKDKILLHGLIYIAKGKDLPALNTYLICHAFWREDKATSQICLNTNNPFYNFHQLVPIINGPDFLERTKENCIITEVYSRNSNGIDSLLGIAKLPVHQLYIALRDPLILPHLMKSKYPVISVDGWVSINDPINGHSYGQLFALVAVGTADQIALLEMTRGLRDSAISPRKLRECTRSTSEHRNEMTCTKILSEIQCKTSDNSENKRSQECQTDITMVQDIREHETLDVERQAEDSTVHTIVDRLAQVMQGRKIYHDAQTDMSDTAERPSMEVLEPLDSVSPRNNRLLSSDESSIDGPVDNFQIPSTMYRSVGVGAEFVEDTNNKSIDTSDTQQPLSNDQSESEDVNENYTFRATVEIERAYHLPTLDSLGEVEPSTYVTFQATNDNSKDTMNFCHVTNVCLKSCAPVWNWKCTTKLPKELVHNKEKRLMFKVWSLVDPDSSVQANPEKDTFLGVASVDLSIFMFGSPTLSGFFDIIHSSEVNGQIWVCITPVENIAPIGNYFKSNLSYKTSHLPYSNVCPQNPTINNIGRELEMGSTIGDESISFLSQSLKQKLTELNEITMRLRSRLHDVTNSAFEDEFEPIDSDVENETVNNQQSKKSLIQSSNKQWLSTHQIQNNRLTIADNRYTSNSTSHRTTFENDNYSFGSSKQNDYCINTVDVNDCSYQSRSSLLENNGSSTMADTYPVRGTRVHINHLLDKLSNQLSVPVGPSHFPVKGNVIDLLNSLQQNNSNQRDNINNNNSNKNNNISSENRKVEKCTNSVPTQTEAIDEYPEAMTKDEEPVHRRVKMSTIIREELVELENNDSEEYDDLSRHLMTSNVRYMNATDSFFNPLLYGHLIPDVPLSNPATYSYTVNQFEAQKGTSPENETVQQLDNRYTETFNLTVNNSLQRLWNLTESNVSEDENNRSINQKPSNISEITRMTPSGVSSNFDGNIDVTVVQKSSNDNLMARNVTETCSLSPHSELSNTSLDKESGRLIQDEDDEAILTSLGSTTSIISRQAPDGGNPVEETDNVTVVRQDETQTSLSSSS